MFLDNVENIVLLLPQPKYRECLVAVPLLKGLEETQVVRSDFILSDQVLMEEQVLREERRVIPDLQNAFWVVLMNVLKIIWVIRIYSLYLNNSVFELEDRLNMKVVIQEVSYRGVSFIQDELVLESDNEEVIWFVHLELLEHNLSESLWKVDTHLDRVSASNLVDYLCNLICEPVLLFIFLEYNDGLVVILVLPLVHAFRIGIVIINSVLVESWERFLML